MKSLVITMLIIIAALCVLFRQAFDPVMVIFNNDAPLGYWMDPHQGWNDNNWLGHKSQPMNPTAMAIIHTPVVVFLFLLGFFLWASISILLGKDRIVFNVGRYVWGAFALWFMAKAAYVMWHGPQHHDIFVNCAPAIGAFIMLSGFAISTLRITYASEPKLSMRSLPTPWWAQGDTLPTRESAGFRNEGRTHGRLDASPANRGKPANRNQQCTSIVAESKTPPTA
jgi:hypothetical protein